MGWLSDRYDWRDWFDEEVEVLCPFWTMEYHDDPMGRSGDFALTASFNEWCQNNLADMWEICSGTIRCSTQDAMLLRLYMGGG